MRAPVFIAASMIAALTSFQVPAGAQVRVARPRTVVARPVVVARPTVFVGGYYYPSLYRASLWYDPFLLGSGPGWGPAFYGSGYGSGYGPAYYQYPIYGSRRYDASGSVRLQVSPREADVFVDGYFAGTVDDFDGTFQRLNIAPGEHEIQIYIAGHRPFSQRFYLQPGKSFDIRHTMEPLGPGEPAPPRPNGTPGAGPYSGSGPAEGFGSLSLRVQPIDAEVRIDGEVWQGSLENERLVVQLGAGTHQIEIHKTGYRNYVTDISIGNGQARTLNVALTKQ